MLYVPYSRGIVLSICRYETATQSHSLFPKQPFHQFVGTCSCKIAGFCRGGIYCGVGFKSGVKWALMTMLAASASLASSVCVATASYKSLCPKLPTCDEGDVGKRGMCPSSKRRSHPWRVSEALHWILS